MLTAILLLITKVLILIKGHLGNEPMNVGQFSTMFFHLIIPRVDHSGLAFIFNINWYRNNSVWQSLVGQLLVNIANIFLAYKNGTL